MAHAYLSVTLLSKYYYDARKKYNLYLNPQIDHEAFALAIICHTQSNTSYAIIFISTTETTKLEEETGYYWLEY